MIGSLFLSILVACLLQLFAFGMFSIKRYSDSKRAKSIWKMVQRKAFWTVPTGIVLEGFMIVQLASLLTITYPNWQSTGQKIDTILAYFFGVLSILFMLLFPLLMYCNR